MWSEFGQLYTFTCGSGFGKAITPPTRIFGCEECLCIINHGEGPKSKNLSSHHYIGLQSMYGG